MNEFLESVKSLNTPYVYMHNGIVEVTNIPNQNDLSFNKDLKLILIHDIDSNTDIKISLFDNLNLNILEIFKIKGTNLDLTINKEIELGTNSSLELTTIEYDGLNESHNGNLSFNLKTTLNENSNLVNFKLVLFNSSFLTNEETSLVSPNSKVENFNVYVNYSHKLQKVNSNVLHLAKDTTSQMRNYGICKFNSNLELNTNGIIKNGAKRSNVNQKNTGLLIDLDSKITASPWLQIDEYDCLASHGAGIGALDDEAMYYLMSRGLDRLTSEKLIISGFVNPIYEKIENEDIKNKIISLVDIYL